jgi:hypothetical protein
MGDRGWQQFLELGRARGWFWPENRDFLISLVGEETMRKMPVEPREGDVNNAIIRCVHVEFSFKYFQYFTFILPSPPFFALLELILFQFYSC